MAQVISRRPLTFDDFDAVVRDVETLQANGFERAGRWDLAQVCEHLNDWLRYPIDGYPRPALPIRLAIGILRPLVITKALRQILANGTMPAGRMTLPETVHPPGCDEDRAVTKFRDTIQRFQAFDGPFQTSPMFGTLGRDQMIQLQLIHCAHHLSFLIPKESNGGNPDEP